MKVNLDFHQAGSSHVLINVMCFVLENNVSVFLAGFEGFYYRWRIIGAVLVSRNYAPSALF